jgi:paraquat-inducible protein B
VTVSFHPERLLTITDPAQQARIEQVLKGDDKRRNAFLQRMIDERGLRAQLRTGSLLTGQLYVAFDYFPKAAKASIDDLRGTTELPVVASDLVDLQAKLASILDKIDKLPLDQIAASLSKDLASLDQTLTGATKLIKRVDTELVPASRPISRRCSARSATSTARSSTRTRRSRTRTRRCSIRTRRRSRSCATR